MMDSTDFRPKPRTARGFSDRRGPVLARERDLIAKIAGVFELWGFEPLDTPALEYADVLGKFLPDQERPNAGVFALEDDDAQWLALRYDLTAPLARFAAENFDALPKPYRRWAAGRVWRNEKPGPGRFREFTQCDADTIGAPGPAADAEMIALGCAALCAAGLAPEQFAIKISTRKLLDALLLGIGIAPGQEALRLGVLRAIDKLDRLGPRAVAHLLGPGRRDESGDFTPGMGLKDSEIERVLAFVQAGRDSRAASLTALAKALPESAHTQAGLEELAAIHHVLAALGVDDHSARIDPSVVRGLEYYTGPVFEAELLSGGQALGSIGGGGRYDDLVSRFRGQPCPATGISIGISRLLTGLSALDGGARRTGPVIVLVMDSVAASMEMAAHLRADGVASEAYLGGAGVRAQMKYADKRGAPVVVIEGEDERARGIVTLKNLALGAALSENITDRKEWREARPAQREVPKGEWIAAVKAMLLEAGE